MKNNNVALALSILICVILLIALAIDESELHDLKAEMAKMQETISTLQTENANTIEELNAATRRAVEAEDKLAEYEQAAYDTQAYTYNYSYYDPEYDDMSAKDYIAQRESGQDYDARNGRYIGKYQLDESMLNGDYSPENQEYMADQYVMERYGSWEAAREFWDSHGWY